MNGIQEILQRNLDVAHEAAIKRPDSKIGFVSKALIEKRLAILGPCAAQSPEQMEEIATLTEQAQTDFVIVVRCCHDKPRSLDITTQGELSWTGVGMEKGRAILSELRAKHPGLKIFAEIREPEQIDMLAPLLDGVWIGNREGHQTIRKVSAAAARHHIPIFVKNGSLDGQTGIKDMEARLVAALVAASVIENNKCVGLSSIVIPLLRGTPADNDPIHRNRPNTHWISPLRELQPDMLITVDVGHLPKAREGRKTGDPDALPFIEQAILTALATGANGFMTEITASVPSKTDAGVPAVPFLQWLSTVRAPERSMKDAILSVQ